MLGPVPGRIRVWLIVLAVLVGLLTGMGAFTFHYARGFSYFGTDPRACRNCHIMDPQYDSWQNASHHTSATCVDCHLPHRGLAKWLAKASNGYHHSKGFTFDDFHEPIMIKEGNSRSLQQNCLRCHGPVVHDIVAGSASAAPGALRCVHCHRAVGHGETLGMGGPETPIERQQERLDE
jgi:cytochrome c nitrite reductase small subunit